MSYRGRGRGGFYNNNRGNFNQNQGQGPNTNNVPTSQNINQFISGNSIPVEILGWNGASMEDCVKFISRKCRIVVSNASIDPQSGAMKGYVKSQKDADDLCNWSGVKFAGQSLKITKAIGAGATTTAVGSSTIETITAFLKSRYSPEMKLLNLTAVQADPTLQSKGFFATISTTSKFFPALMKVAHELKIEVDSIDLSGNNLTDLSTISTLSTTFPTLKNLSLSNNAISRLKVFETWRHKLNLLRELIITGNPILNQANPQEIKAELMKSFPRLIVVNGEVLRNEAMLNSILAFPYPNPQQMFFQDEEIQGMSTNFVTSFFGLWDSNRRDLIQLYQAESQFSLSVDMSHPHMLEVANVDFGYYLPFSRNLTKISASKSRMSKVCIGPDQIFKAFTQLPKSKHELVTKPDMFSMETYRFPQVNGIIINLHGTFGETAPPENLEAFNNAAHRNRFQNNRNKKPPLSNKSFDRSFVVIPGPNGSMILASDSLVIRSPSGCDSWSKQSKLPTPPPAQPQQQQQKLPQTPPPNGPSALPMVTQLPPDVKAMLNAAQQEILIKVSLETNLNLQYGLMLCQQSNWDYQQCIINFKNSVGSLPRDAYAS
ncbi:nuclear mRNA export, poly(A)+RNA binding protein [Yamadazyma tenuis]|uniref:NTF2-like protein n=1 Tax=Candida tenuis (strain ATCC 10573 / BCRC 21748 / CBS 615 / JCM 9827 / NBRC 10315 / NRRL Y-1498 / VKM Y-70) TaxID=590646 RepID=G3B3M1_CANTC|nr:NTF2-like protein [Yamadazyma tenuis ATCC 10573]EGV64186.1 NTF2-like protein [Yamadazyma tenuis ATCC 10573]WEJ96155.1 nuclear mRNA export, poly(A)+RNA binding protein [Yamadazyma tenuis]